MKQYYFLVSLPRSGNTVISSLLNQNPRISATANSILPDILWKLHQEKQNNLIFRNFPDHKSYNNMMKGLIESYYKDWTADIIVDRSNWGSPNNLELIKQYSPTEPKFIILVRDVLEVLASFIKWSEETPNNFLDHETNKGSREEKCEFLMRPDLQIVQEYSSIFNILKNESKDSYILVDYNCFVSDPRSQILKIYDFLQLDLFDHDYNNISQFSTNGINYDDSVVGENLHRVKQNGIYKSNYLIEQYLPRTVIEKYSNLNFWKDHALL
jgi:hypothetical protein